MENPQEKPKKIDIDYVKKRQKLFAFIGLVLLLTGLVVTGLLGYFTVVGIGLCVLGVLFGSVVFLPKFTKNLNVYANLTAYSFFVCASLVVFFLIVQRHPLTYDATSSKRFSLNPITKNFLERLDQPVKATAFINSSNKSEQTMARLKLDEYARYSPNFSYQILDPGRDANQARKYAIAPASGEVYLEVTSGTLDSDKVVKANKIEEEDLTNGIVQLLRGGKLNLYFTTGHGEPPLEEDKASAVLIGSDDGGANLDALNKLLRSAYVNTVGLDLRMRGSIPVDASAIVVAAPKTDFSAAEVQSIVNYLESGGKAIFLLNPDVLQIRNEVRSNFKNLSSLLERYGISIPSEVVVFPLESQAGQSVYTVPTESNDHRITHWDNTVGKARLVFDQARPIIPAVQPPNNVFTDVFLTSVDQAWGLSVDELTKALMKREEIKKLPNISDLKMIPIGVAATYHKPGASEAQTSKIVVVGNGSFTTTARLDQKGWLMFMNAVNWATNTGDLIAIPSAKVIETPSSLTPGQKQFIFILCVIAIPTLIGLGGLGYSISRRGVL